MPEEARDNPYGCGLGGLICAILLWLYSKYDITNPLRADEQRVGYIIALLVAGFSVWVLLEVQKVRRKEKRARQTYQREQLLYQQTHPLGQDGCAKKVAYLCRGRTGEGTVSLADGVVLHFKYEEDRDTFIIRVDDRTVFLAAFVRWVNSRVPNAEPEVFYVPQPDGSFKQENRWPEYRARVDKWTIYTYLTEGNWELLLSQSAPLESSTSS